jgi:transcriptional regulator with XRE-family HTH domain
MTLREWMDRTNIDVLEASRAFGVSVYAVKKWVTGERMPRAANLAKIRKVTKGAVNGNDWIPKD